MQKKTKDALKVAGITAAVMFMVLPGTFEWVRAKYMGTAEEKAKAEAYGKATQDTFKKT
jgi:hypothetical protein